MLSGEQDDCEKCVLLLKAGAKAAVPEVCYVDFEIKETIFLLAVFAKNEIENLSIEERLKLKHQIDILEDNL